ncbi:hypothetical protein FF38_06615 [Lucilia cuprina]|uniref:Uncharacterized protein n=1 Tax=Lucilia cuprina TaxID=7375 RepID=A0A0L0CJ47_LUCCU|nr:hypothetical protein FF38_06615 [Lucilia cuprina]
MTCIRLTPLNHTSHLSTNLALGKRVAKVPHILPVSQALDECGGTNTFITFSLKDILLLSRKQHRSNPELKIVYQSFNLGLNHSHYVHHKRCPVGFRFLWYQIMNHTSHLSTNLALGKRVAKVPHIHPVSQALDECGDTNSFLTLSLKVILLLSRKQHRSNPELKIVYQSFKLGLNHSHYVHHEWCPVGFRFLWYQIMLISGRVRPYMKSFQAKDTFFNLEVLPGFQLHQDEGLSSS